MEAQDEAVLDALRETMLNLESFEEDLSRVKRRLAEWIERLDSPDRIPKGGDA